MPVLQLQTSRPVHAVKQRLRGGRHSGSITRRPPARDDDGGGGAAPAAETPVPRALNHLLHRAAQRADAEVERALASLVLTARQFAVLDEVERHADDSQIRLGAKTGIDRSTLVNIIDRLQRRGLIERHRSKFDRRESVLRLTDAGREILELARPAVRLANEALMASVPHEQQGAFLSQLEQFVDRAD